MTKIRISNDPKLFHVGCFEFGTLEIRICFEFRASIFEFFHFHRVFSGSEMFLKPFTASVIDFSTGIRSAVDPPT